MQPVRTKPRREDLTDGQILCDFCTAKCCRYFALAIEAPQKREDFDYMRWMLLHELASVFVEDDVWYLLVHSPCKHLQSNNLCGIYDTRPQICRQYSTDKCEYEDDWTYEMYFETAEQLDEYCDALYSDPAQPGFRSPQPPLLPILHAVPA